MATSEAPDDNDLQFDIDAVAAKAREFSQARSQEKVIKSYKETLRDALLTIVELEGEEDADGNVVLELPEQVLDIARLVKQRKTSNGLNGQVAEEILREAGLWEQCTETVHVLDEDKVMAAHFNGDLTEEQVDLMFPTVVTYAFTTPKK
jgi:hypothetical protein